MAKGSVLGKFFVAGIIIIAVPIIYVLGTAIIVTIDVRYFLGDINVETIEIVKVSGDIFPDDYKVISKAGNIQKEHVKYQMVMSPGSYLVEYYKTRISRMIVIQNIEKLSGST